VTTLAHNRRVKLSIGAIVHGARHELDEAGFVARESCRPLRRSQLTHVALDNTKRSAFSCSGLGPSRRTPTQNASCVLNGTIWSVSMARMSTRAKLRAGMSLLAGGLGMAMFATRLQYVGNAVPPAFLVAAFAMAIVGSWIVVELANEACDRGSDDGA
jgi:hypothetical protein